MTKLDEIITAEAKKFSAPLRPEGLNLLIYNVALEFAKHILEEAAEQCVTETIPYFKATSNQQLKNVEIWVEDGNVPSWLAVVNKKSITDILNKYL